MRLFASGMVLGVLLAGCGKDSKPPPAPVRQLVDSWSQPEVRSTLLATYAEDGSLASLSYEKRENSYCDPDFSLSFSAGPDGSSAQAILTAHTLCGGCAGSDDVYDWTLTYDFRLEGGRVAGDTEDLQYQRLACTGMCRLPCYRTVVASEHTVLEGTWEYDEAGRLARVAHRDGTGTAVREQVFAYDEAGRVIDREARLAGGQLAVHWTYAYGADGLRSEDTIEIFNGETLHASVHGIYSYAGNSGTRTWGSGTDSFTFHASTSASFPGLAIDGGFPATSFLGDLWFEPHLAPHGAAYMPFF